MSKSKYKIIGKDITKVIDNQELLIKKIVYEENRIIKYSLDK